MKFYYADIRGEIRNEVINRIQELIGRDFGWRNVRNIDLL
jgi:hypothetical protein